MDSIQPLVYIDTQGHETVQSFTSYTGDRYKDT